MSASRRARRGPRLKQTLMLMVALLAVASIWYLIAPPRSAPAYRQRAEETVESLRSQVQTVRLWTRELERGRVLHAAAIVGLEDAESDATAASVSFASLDPPPGTAAIRSDVSALADRVTSVLEEIRIAAHAGDWAVVLDRRADLAKLAPDLERLQVVP